MKWLFNAAYGLALAGASPRILYRRMVYGRYKRGWSQRLWGQVPLGSRRCPRVWFHAVSVGEVNLLRPLFAWLQEHHPHWELVLSTGTDAGYDLAQKLFPHLTVFFAPWDFSWAVSRALQRLDPQLLVLVELELWPQLIHQAHARQVPVAVINGRLSRRSFRGYKLLGPVVRRMLGKVALVAAQTPEYARRFVALGADPARVHVTGSLKFDGVETNRNNPHTQRLRHLAQVQPGQVVFLAGSTQAAEEQMALEAFRRVRREFDLLRLILVPRHPERFDQVARWLQEQGQPFLRRSRLNQPPQHWNPECVLLVDTVGELRHWWGVADVALVGGSFGSRGGQNMIEPAAYGAAVCFGPRTENFRDVVAMLLECQGAVVVHSQQELMQFVRRCVHQRDWAKELGQRARKLVLQQQGATQQTANLLVKLMQTSPASAARAA